MLLSRLKEKNGKLVLDGGLATELERRGHDLNHPLWSAHILVEHPEAIEAVLRDFAEAGADILATATYQATFPGLERQGFSREEAGDLLRKAVALARRVSDTHPNHPLVAASIGPYGAYLADGSEYRGDYGISEEELADFHRERLSVLTEAGVDVIAFETFPSGPEVRAVAELMTDEFPGLEAWISMSCQTGSELWDGTPLGEIAAFLGEQPGIAAIGINCIDPEFAVESIEVIRESAPGKKVIAYPNAGKGWDTDARRWRGADTPEEFATRAEKWFGSGADIVGGCCQTTPGHIREIAALAHPSNS